MQNKLDNYDTIKLNKARNLIGEVYNYNFKIKKRSFVSKVRDSIEET